MDQLHSFRAFILSACLYERLQTSEMASQKLTIHNGVDTGCSFITEDTAQIVRP